MADTSYKMVTSKTVYQNKWITVREDAIIKPNGEESVYSVVDTTPGVIVVAITDKQDIILIRQFRYPTQTHSLELIKGGSESYNFLEDAKRELWEETGLAAQDIREIGTIQAFNGLCSEISHIFLAENLHQTEQNKQDEEGIADLEHLTFADIDKLIKEGKITDSQTISAIMLTRLKG